MLTPRGGTHSSSSPCAGRGWLNPALSHPYSALAQPQPCPGTWAGLGRGERTGQLWHRESECVGLGGSTARCCWCGTIVSACRRVAGGGRRPHHFAAVLASASCHQPGFSWDPAPLLTQGVQDPADIGDHLPHPPCKHQPAAGLLPVRRAHACAEDGCWYHVCAERLERVARGRGHPQHLLPNSTAQRGLNTAGAGGMRLGNGARALKNSREIPKSSKASPQSFSLFVLNSLPISTPFRWRNIPQSLTRSSPVQSITHSPLRRKEERV